MCFDTIQNISERSNDQSTRIPHPNVFVRGIPMEWSEPELVALFENFGKLTSVRLVRHSTKKSSLGYGFVRYERVEDAAQAIEALRETMIGGQCMQVKLADSDAGPPATSSLSGLTPCDSCYVKHVPAFYTKEHLIQLFSNYGVVADVKIYPCLDSFRGYSALVKMDSIESASKAVEGAHGMQPEGSLHSLIVRFAESVAEKQARLGRKELASEDNIAAIQVLAALTHGNLNVGYRDTSGNQAKEHLVESTRQVPSVVHSGIQLPSQPQSLQNVSVVKVLNLAPFMDRLWLYEQFAKFGAILLVTIDPAGGSGKIVYSSITAALEAKHAFHDTVHGSHRLCVTATVM